MIRRCRKIAKKKRKGKGKAKGDSDEENKNRYRSRDENTESEARVERRVGNIERGRKIKMNIKGRKKK